jgi:hypothetical protein
MIKDFWPRDLRGKIKSGFSDDELELICDWGLRGYDKCLQYKSARWIYWPVELYSFGRCYRDWLNLPSWIPLPLYGDHGVNCRGELDSHELTSKPKVYLTWFKGRAENLAERKEKNVLRITHPWISYRRKYDLKKKNDACGTLIFLSHSNDGIEITNYDWGSYFDELKKLPDEYQPLLVCMHRHDVSKGYHKAIRKYNIPIVSAGETSSPYFIDRFYDVLSNFKYATSNTGGSELFYCEEFGVKYFIAGKNPAFLNNGDYRLPEGEDELESQMQDAAVAKKRELFCRFPPVPNVHKVEFVRDVLGLDVNIEESRYQLKKYLIIEYFRHIPEVSVGVLMLILSWVIPDGVKSMLRKFLKT